MYFAKLIWTKCILHTKQTCFNIFDIIENKTCLIKPILPVKHTLQNIGIKIRTKRLLGNHKITLSVVPIY